MANIYKNINLPYPNTLSTTTGFNGTSSYTVSYQPQPLNMHDGSTPVMSIPNGSKTVILEEQATLDVKGIVRINGLNLEERLSTIEKLLQIPQRDVTMESKYPKLKKLYEEYMHELEKLRTWDALKESK